MKFTFHTKHPSHPEARPIEVSTNAATQVAGDRNVMLHFNDVQRGVEGHFSFIQFDWDTQYSVQQMVLARYEKGEFTAGPPPGQLLKADALAILDRYWDTEPIANLYDDNAQLREALGVLIPDFEYPDWSHRTLRQVKDTLRAEVPA